MIANNQGISAGGIRILQSEPEIIGNTICNNQGGGIYLNESKTEIKNTILWGNTATNGSQVFINDNFSSPDIYYCTVQGGISDFGLQTGTTYQGIYENNLETYPEFVNQSSGTGNQPDAESSNWMLKIISPSITKPLWIKIHRFIEEKNEIF